MKEYEDNESGRNVNKSPGKEVEVIWAFDAKKGAPCRQEGYKMVVQGRKKA